MVPNGDVDDLTPLCLKPTPFKGREGLNESALAILMEYPNLNPY